MKFILQVFVILNLAYLLELFLPWYCIAVAAFIIGYLLTSKANFLAGFLAIAILWTIKAWLIDAAGATDLVDRVSNIFALKDKTLLFVVTAVVGGLVGGFAALTGALLKRKN